MNKKVRDAFYRFLKATSLKSDIDRDHVYLSRSYGRNGLLLGWEREAFAYAARALQEVCPMVSEKTIKRMLEASMVKLFEDCNVREDADPDTNAPELESIFSTLEAETCKINQAITELIDRLESKVQSWTAFVFVQGIELQGMRKLPLGKAVLHDIEHGPLSKALQEQKEINQKRGWGRDFEELIQNDTRGCKCYLTIDLEGEKDYADQSAFEQSQNILNVIKFYIASCRQRDTHQRIEIINRGGVVGRRVIFKRSPPFAESDQPIYTCALQDSSFFSYVIDSESVQQWREDYLDKALEYVTSEDQLGSAQLRIRKAITWYSRAVSATSADEQYVNLTIALESLLVADDHVERIKQRLADEVAGLLEGNFRRRQDMKKRVKQLYAERCDIVHKGKPVSMVNLYTLDEAVTLTIVAFLRRETGH